MSGHKRILRHLAAASASFLMAAAFAGALPASADEVVSFHTDVVIHPKHLSWVDEYGNQRSSAFCWTELVPETDACPALTEALNSLNAQMEARRDEFYARGQGGEEHFTSMYCQRPEIYREDSQVFSVLIYDSDPENDFSDESRFYNFDSQTGQPIELSQVLATTDGLAEIIDSEARLRDKYNRYTGNADDIRAIIDSGTLRWGLGYDGLKVRVSFPYSYDGSYYSEQIFDLTVLFSEHPELFMPTYQVLPDSYCIKMDSGRDYVFDLGDDGTMDTVRFTELEDSYEYLTGIEASVNGSPTNLSFAGKDMSWYFDATPYYIHRAGGESYFYISLDGEDSDLLMGCYKAEGNSMTELEVFSEGLRIQFEGSGEYFLSMDPYSNLFSTYSGFRYCRVGSGGWPVPVTDDYDISGASQTLVLKREMTFDVVDGTPDAQVSGNRTLPAGTRLNFWRSDLHSYVDLRLEEENTFVRVYFAGDYPYTANGIDATEVFDGMLYAG